MSAKLLYEGSVKSLYELTDENCLLFSYSNRYSIYDWGEMPDQLEHKGKALAWMGASFFELMKKNDWSQLKCPKSVDTTWFNQLKNSRTFHRFERTGLNHHFVGLENDGSMKVKKVEVLRPTWTGHHWNYWKYEHHPNVALVPLEVIFRFGLPEGSSFFNRAKDPFYLQTLGVDVVPAQGEWFQKPVIEFSTKLEPTDRYLSYAEAKNIAGMSEEEFTTLIETAQLAAIKLFGLFTEMGIELWDGKFEFAFDGVKQFSSREVMLVDSIGPDELRLLYKGKHLSKEYLRQVYRSSDWFQDLQEAKNQAKQNNDLEWKKYCKSAPAPLTTLKKNEASEMYQHLANKVSFMAYGKKPFSLNEDLESFLQHFGEAK